MGKMDPKYQYWSSRLCGASKAGNLEDVQQYLDEGDDINERAADLDDDFLAATPLHLACIASRYHINVIMELLSRGADVTIQSRNGETALEECTRRRQEGSPAHVPAVVLLEAVALLEERGLSRQQCVDAVKSYATQEEPLKYESGYDLVQALEAHWSLEEQNHLDEQKRLKEKMKLPEERMPQQEQQRLEAQQQHQEQTHPEDKQKAERLERDMRYLKEQRKQMTEQQQQFNERQKHEEQRIKQLQFTLQLQQKQFEEQRRLHEERTRQQEHKWVEVQRKIERQTQLLEVQQNQLQVNQQQLEKQQVHRSMLEQQQHCINEFSRLEQQTQLVDHAHQMPAAEEQHQPGHDNSDAFHSSQDQHFSNPSTNYASDSSNNNQTGVECVVCFEWFTSQGDHLPILFSCGHTLCKECVQHIATTSSVSSSTPTLPSERCGGGSVVACAVCRTQTVLPENGVDAMNINEAVVGVVRRVELQQNQQQPQLGICGHCEDRQVEKFCRDCKDEFCRECFEAQHFSKKKQGHITMPAAAKNQVLCEQHNKELDLYCNTCSKSVCFACHFGPCKTHDVQLVGEVVEKQRQTLRDWIQKLGQEKQNVTGQINYVSGLMTESTQSLDTSIQNIKNTVKRLQQAIVKQEEELVNFVQKQGEAKLKTLQLHKDNLQMIHICIDKMMHSCRSVIQQEESSHSAAEFVELCSPCVAQAASVALHSTKLCDMKIMPMLADQTTLVTHITTRDKMDMDCNSVVEKMKQWMLPRLPCFVEVANGVVVSHDGMHITNHHNRSNKSQDNSHKFAFSEEISSTDTMLWRVKIASMSNSSGNTNNNKNCAIFVGIISTNTAGSSSFESKSSFGWSGSRPSHSSTSLAPTAACYIDGKGYGTGSAIAGAAALCACGDWSGWQEGDEAIMKLDCVSNTLSMKHTPTNTVHCIRITPEMTWKIHVNLSTASDSVHIAPVLLF